MSYKSLRIGGVKSDTFMNYLFFMKGGIRGGI